MAKPITFSELPGNTKKSLEKALAYAQENGWRLERGNRGHLRYRKKDAVIHGSSTPSDFRADRKLLADLKRKDREMGVISEAFDRAVHRKVKHAEKHSRKRETEKEMQQVAQKVSNGSMTKKEVAEFLDVTAVTVGIMGAPSQSKLKKLPSGLYDRESVEEYKRQRDERLAKQKAGKTKKTTKPVHMKKKIDPETAKRKPGQKGVAPTSRPQVEAPDGKLTVVETAEVLGLTTSSVVRYSSPSVGLLTKDEDGFYDEEEVLAFMEARDKGKPKQPQTDSDTNLRVKELMDEGMGVTKAIEQVAEEEGMPANTVGNRWYRAKPKKSKKRKKRKTKKKTTTLKATVTSIDMKKCVGCGQHKAYDQFQKNRVNDDGLQEACEDCIRTANAERDRKYAELGVGRGEALTVHEIAKQYGLSREKVMQLVEQGEIRGFDMKSGWSSRQSWAINGSDLERYLADQKKAGYKPSETAQEPSEPDTGQVVPDEQVPQYKGFTPDVLMKEMEKTATEHFPMTPLHIGQPMKVKPVVNVELTRLAARVEGMIEASKSKQVDVIKEAYADLTGKMAELGLIPPFEEVDDEAT